MARKPQFKTVEVRYPNGQILEMAEGRARQFLERRQGYRIATPQDKRDYTKHQKEQAALLGEVFADLDEDESDE